jgi:CheY-like chemotaxis protein
MIMARILIIDDEAQIRMMLSQMLSNEGHAVEAAEDGMAGLKAVKTNPFDIVITDIIMPEKEGIETIMHLKKLYPAIRIIAISGGGRLDPKSILNYAGKLGAEYTFQKPIDRQDLLNAINALTG